MKKDVFKYVFSAAFGILATLMILFDWFKTRIDGTIITIILIAFLPWLIKYVKSLEAFGMKIDLIPEEKKNKINKEIQEIKKDSINEKKIIDPNSIIDKKKPIGSEKNPILIESMESIARTNNVLDKMVLIRYEIEKNIKILCRVNNIQTYERTIKEMVKNLKDSKIIKGNVADLLLEILPMLNKTVHSDINKIELDDLDWIIDKGSALVMHLEIISKNPDAYWMINFDKC